MSPRLFGLLLLAMLLAGDPARAETIRIFAAASMSDAISRSAADYEAAGCGSVDGVFAASSTLARQIAQGAPADLFLSASQDWMDYLAQRNVLAPGSRRDIAGNSLVVVALRDARFTEAEDAAGALRDAARHGRVALGDPSHVPSGIYARQALQELGLWPDLAGRTAFASNVRTALALVTRGEAAAGIVYATDARVSDAVRVVATLPPASHGPIRYPLAIVAERDSPAARRFHAFLSGPQGQALLASHGFLSLDGPAAADPAGKPC